MLPINSPCLQSVHEIFFFTLGELLYTVNMQPLNVSAASWSIQARNTVSSSSCEANKYTLLSTHAFALMKPNGLPVSHSSRL